MAAGDTSSFDPLMSTLLNCAVEEKAQRPGIPLPDFAQ
jgi:hypothetical protein